MWVRVIIQFSINQSFVAIRMGIKLSEIIFLEFVKSVLLLTHSDFSTENSVNTLNASVSSAWDIMMYDFKSLLDLFW